MIGTNYSIKPCVGNKISFAASPRRELEQLEGAGRLLERIIDSGDEFVVTDTRREEGLSLITVARQILPKTGIGRLLRPRSRNNLSFTVAYSKEGLPNFVNHSNSKGRGRHSNILPETPTGLQVLGELARRIEAAVARKES